MLPVATLALLLAAPSPQAESPRELVVIGAAQPIATLLFHEPPITFRYPKAYAPVLKSRATPSTPLYVQVPFGSGAHVSIQVFPEAVTAERFEELLRTEMFPLLKKQGLKVQAESWSGLSRPIAGVDRAGKRWAGRALQYSFFLESFVFADNARTVWVLFLHKQVPPNLEAEFQVIASTLELGQ